MTRDRKTSRRAADGRGHPSYPALAPVVGLLMCAGFAIGQEQTPPQERPLDESYRISVDVTPVLLNLTVKERNGGFVSGLQKENFIVYEDGRPQKITHFSEEEVPVTVGLVIDRSRSMRGMWGHLIATAATFARTSKPEDEIFVTVFNEHVEAALPGDTLFTNDSSVLTSALREVIPDGKTAMFDGVVKALQHADKGKNRKKALIVFSDGGDNASSIRRDQLMEAARRSDAIIYTVGIYAPWDGDADPRLLRRLASETGGEAHFPKETAEMLTMIRRIADDIRSQYTLTYYSSNGEQDGAYRRLQVRVADPEHKRLEVRTREGYYANVQRTAGR